MFASFDDTWSLEWKRYLNSSKANSYINCGSISKIQVTKDAFMPNVNTDGVNKHGR
jgi:hypothetical protein